MEDTTNTFSLVLEWLSWVLFFFSWAIIVKVALRRKRMKKPYQKIKDRKAYYFTMIFGFLVFLFILLFGVDPFISFLVNNDVIIADQGPIVFWLMAGVLFFSIPFLIVPLSRRIFREN